MLPVVPPKKRIWEIPETPFLSLPLFLSHPHPPPPPPPTRCHLRTIRPPLPPPPPFKVLEAQAGVSSREHTFSHPPPPNDNIASSPVTPVNGGPVNWLKLNWGSRGGGGGSGGVGGGRGGSGGGGGGQGGAEGVGVYGHLVTSWGLVGRGLDPCRRTVN